MVNSQITLGAILHCNKYLDKFKEYSALLLKNDLLSIPSTYHDHAQRYEITPRGVKCLELIEEIEFHLIYAVLPKNRCLLFLVYHNGKQIFIQTVGTC
jgi:predicted transcriptional regulator